jgi:methylenetetrahydrofolate reductase (NADPH)
MSTLRERIVGGSEFIITCELVPGRGSGGAGVEHVIEFGRRVVAEKLPIHAISLTDNPGGNPAMSPDLLARELLAMGIEPLVHFSCRDLNRNQVESRACALARAGLHNLLVLTGDYPAAAAEGLAKPVFDLDAVQALRFLRAMNAGLEIPGRKPGTTDRLPPTSFFLCCAVSPFKKLESELMPQFFKLEKKLAAGAEMVISQLGYDVRKFAEIAKYLRYRGLGGVPILGNVYVLTKGAAATMNRGAVPGCVVTDELMRQVETEAEAPDKGKKARLERAAQLMAIFRGMKFRGVHLGGFGLKFEDFQNIILRSQEIGENWREHIRNFGFAKPGEFYLFPDDPELTFAEDKLAPVPLTRKPALSPNFHMSRCFHRCVFTEGTPLWRLSRWAYGLLERWKPAARCAYFFERNIKRLLFDCQECGDCALFELAYLCPMSRCAKNQRNGACGGTRNGRCEVYEEKRCVWAMAYERYAALGKLDEMRTGFLPPVDFALERTSGWANFFLKRDHGGRKKGAGGQ